MYEADYETYLKAEAATYLEDAIHNIAMEFTHEELMELLDRMKEKFTYLYEKEQSKRKNKNI